MAVSSTSNFTISAKRLISSALRISGLLAHGKEADLGLLESGMFALNLIARELDVENLAWTLKESTAMSTVVGQSRYTTTSGLPNDIFRIESLAYVDSATADLGISLITKSRYDSYENNNDRGIPYEAYFEDRQDITAQALNFYLTPDSVKPIRMRYYRRGFDVNAHADEVDFPIHWGSYLRYELAASLGEEAGLSDTKMARLIERARSALQHAKGKGIQKTANLTPLNREYF